MDMNKNTKYIDRKKKVLKNTKDTKKTQKMQKYKRKETMGFDFEVFLKHMFKSNKMMRPLSHIHKKNITW